VQVFKRRGFRASTLEDVARQLNVTRPALYHYILDKQDLLYQIYDQTMTKAMAEAERIVASSEEPHRRLRRLIRSYVELVGQHDMFTIFFQDKAQLKPEHFAAITRRERAFVRLFETVYREGVRRGEFRPLAPTIVAFGSIGMCSWIYKWFDPQGRLSLEQVADLFGDVVLTGVLARGRAPRSSRRGGVNGDERKHR
jgi:AcrR family transcriptional regulator